MTDVRVASFPIALLEYVFVPPGLPLVTKSDAPATTSILVRGGAGTGKTTLAAALAHAISRDQGGVALYLTTEFVATELAYKASSLRLPDNSVDSWTSASSHEPGAIVAEHLLRTRAGASDEDITTVAARKRAAIRAVWELLAGDEAEPSGERPVGPPVRAVVIDGFGLPEVEQEDAELRHELLALLQSLELVGITPILVEEAGVHAEAWLPFVVDIVFEIEMWPDPDTGYLLRKLKCPKSRYGQAIPGPHDYGRDDEGFAVWPDLPLEHRRLRNLAQPPPAIFYPWGPEYVVMRAGSVLISALDQPPAINHIFRNTPGIRPALISCGPVCEILIPNRKPIVADEHNGIFALAWTLLRYHDASNFNSVIIQGLGFFLSRPRLRASALRMVVLLSRSGLSICIHGRSVENEAAHTIADFVRDVKYAGHTMRRSNQYLPCRADRWINAFRSNLEFGDDLRLLFDGRRSASEIADAIPPLASDVADYDHLGLVFPEPPTAPRSLQALAFALHLAGQCHHASEYLDPKPATAEIAFAQAEFYITMGEGLTAAVQCAAWNENPDFRRVWGYLSAIYAENASAIDAIGSKDMSDVPETELIVLLQAFSRGGERRLDRLNALIQSCSDRFGLPNWYLDRLRAERHLDVESGTSWARAAEELGRLSKHASIPAVHRAEICYNLGVAKNRLGDKAGAREAYQRAIELNELLEPAAAALD